MARKLWGTGTQTLRWFKLKERRRRRVHFFDRKENPQGEMIKITEVCGGERLTIVFPPELGPAAALYILRLSDKDPGVNKAIKALLETIDPEILEKGGD